MVIRKRVLARKTGAVEVDSARVGDTHRNSEVVRASVAGTRAEATSAEDMGEVGTLAVADIRADTAEGRSTIVRVAAPKGDAILH